MIRPEIPEPKPFDVWRMIGRTVVVLVGLFVAGVLFLPAVIAAGDRRAKII